MQRPFFELSPETTRKLRQMAQERADIETGAHSSLSAWLIANDISDQAFADRAGVTRGYISRVRRNMLDPALSTALRIHAATGHQIPLNSLLPRSKPPVERPNPDAVNRRHHS